MKQAVIVTGGTMDLKFALSYIHEQKPDILGAVDSGMEFFFKAGQKPHVIVGDFDSVKQDTLAFFKGQQRIDWVELVPEKDDTDTEAAIREMIRRECEKIHILGATGSRLDHVLSNIGLLGIGLSEGIEILMVDPSNRIRMTDKGISIRREEQFGDYVSLLPFTPKVTGLTLKGMKYPLLDYEYACFSSLGISNEIVEDEAEISFTEGVLLVIESRDR
ncbi:MAG: thiamine diphosphokinase [Roseburia sp.]|nr:thiamine diphosphokinase [Roseburia sp.]